MCCLSIRPPCREGALETRGDLSWLDGELKLLGGAFSVSKQLIPSACSELSTQVARLSTPLSCGALTRLPSPWEQLTDKPDFLCIGEYPEL
jgi:hypothetical protein